MTETPSPVRSVRTRSTAWRVGAAFLVGALLGGMSVVELAPPGQSLAEAGAEQPGAVAAPGAPGAPVDEGAGTTGTGGGGGTSGASGAATSGSATSGSATSGTTTTGSATTGSATSGTTTAGTATSTTGAPATTGGTTGSGSSGSASGGGGGAGSTSGTGSATGGGTTGTTTGNAQGPQLSCDSAGNGGATDRGVTATEIHLATTVVESGAGSAFLGEVRYAMDAVANAVNRDGGICGRQLRITYADDGWEAQRGAQYLRNYIEQGVFAIPVGPSSEGLNAVIESGDFDAAGVPVVGTDGLIIKQYERSDGAAQPWVWPVAVATVSSARILARDAYERGARTFSIVFDRNYRFGVEAAEAFNSEVRRLTGTDIDGYNPDYNCDTNFCGIDAGQNSYSPQVGAFTEAEFVALFLDPETAQKWMNDPNAPAAIDVPFGYGGGQPLFTTAFGVNCKSKCDGMQVWTGFKPYIEQYRSDPAVRAYVDALKSTNPNADEANQFSQGAYVGMQLLVQGLQEVGPNLTREGLRAVLDQTELTTGLTLEETLRYTPDNRYVATTMQAWTIQYKGTFGGWRAGQVVSDPQPTAGLN